MVIFLQCIAFKDRENSFSSRNVSSRHIFSFLFHYLKTVIYHSGRVFSFFHAEYLDVLYLLVLEDRSVFDSNCSVRKFSNEC